MVYQEVIDALYEKVIEDLLGLIALWSGAIVDIPDGWHLCDGTNGTVDLRDQFIIGAGDAFNPGDAGGATTHTHAFTVAPHSHAMTAGTVLGVGTDYALTTDSIPLAGTTDAGSSLPPYYALAYIQKV